MHIQQKSIVLDAVRQVQFANVFHSKVVQKSAYTELMIVGVAFQVVYVEDQSASRSSRELIQESCVGIFAPQSGNIFEQKTAMHNAARFQARVRRSCRAPPRLRLGKHVIAQFYFAPPT